MQLVNVSRSEQLKTFGIPIRFSQIGNYVLVSDLRTLGLSPLRVS